MLLTAATLYLFISKDDLRRMNKRSQPMHCLLSVLALKRGKPA